MRTHKPLSFLCVLLLSLCMCSRLLAQSALAQQAALDALLKARVEIAAAIVAGTQKPAAALARLRSLTFSGTRPIDAAADLSGSAMDVGNRLVAAGKHAEAELFFQAAEQSLVFVIKATPDTEPQTKAQHLQNLALIRGRFLNKASQAKLNIEQAIALQPKDESLRSTRAMLAREKADLFETQSATSVK